MTFRVSMIAGLIAAAAAVSAPRAQIGLAMSADSRNEVVSCAFAAERMEMKVRPGALLTTMVTTTPGQPWVLAASAGPVGALSIHGIDGQLLIDPKGLVIVAAGVTGSLGGASPCEGRPDGVKLGLTVPRALTGTVVVHVQALAGMGDSVDPLKLGFSQPLQIEVSPGS